MKIIRAIKKIWLFFKKEERKIVSILFLFAKILLALCMVLILPASYFLFSIYIKPRALPDVNQYIENQILKKYDNIQFSLENSKLGFNSSWNFTYNIEDVSIKLPEQKDKFNFPEVLIELDLWSLLIKKIRIDNITISKADLHLTKGEEESKNVEVVEVKPDEQGEAELNKYAKKVYDSIVLLNNLKFPIRGLSLKNSNIILLNKGVEKKIKLVQTNLRFNFKPRFVDVQIYNLFNLNKNTKKNITLNGSCLLFKNQNVFCNSEFYNFNVLDLTDILKDYVPIVNKYEKNFDTVLSGEISLLFENYVKLKEAKYKIFALNGSFDLREFFSEKIDFSNLILEGGVEDNFDKISIDSLKTKFGKTDFSMAMKAKKSKKGADIYLRFDAENIVIDDLKRLWPTFLNQHNIRSWVIQHISNGMVPEAYADMDLVYDKELGQTFTKRIDSDVHIANADLNYSAKFPNVNNIYGIATFTKKNMDIKLNKGKIIDTSIIEGNIKSDFTQDIKYLDIYGRTQGKAKDLFAHVNNNDKTSAKIIDYFFDGRTVSRINIKLPVKKDLKIENSSIEISSNIVDNNTSFFNNNSRIRIFLSKELNSKNINGKIDFVNSEIYSAFLGLKKEKTKPTNIIFNILFNEDNVELVNIEAKDSDINFKANGKIMKSGFSKSIQINDIKYGDFDYSVFYNGLLLEGKRQNVLSISGSKFDLREFISSFRRSKKRDGIFIFKDIDNLVLKGNFKNVNLKNDKSLQDIDIELQCENNICYNFNLSGLINEEKTINVNVITKNLKHPEEKRAKINIDDFGYIIDAFDISNKIIDGKGQIKGDLIFEPNNLIFKGTVDVPSKFNIIINNDFSTRVTDDLLRQDILPKLREEILKNNLTFNRMKSDFKLNGNQLEIRNMLLSAYSVVGIGLTMSGDIYLDTGKMDLEGLIIPAEVINSLFGLTKLPLIGSLLDSGVFAAPYKYSRNSYRERGNLEIKKELSVLPGVTRKLFEKPK